MPDYRYRSLKSDGTVLRGRIEAADARDAWQRLAGKGLSPFELTPVETIALPGLGRVMKRRAGNKARARYVRQLATLLDAGMPLLDAMESMARSGYPDLRTASGEIRKALRAGERLSAAFEAHLPAFPHYVARLTELGEATGELPRTLADAATRMEQQVALKSEIRSALTYPAFLAVAGVAITVFMFLVVVPRFETLIGDNRDNLPLISVLVLSASAVFREHVLLFGIAAAGLVAGAVSIARAPGARERVRGLLDRLPLVGLFLRRAELADWTRTMGVALKNGADLITAFDLSARAVRSPVFRQGLIEARRALRAGEPLDEAVGNAIALDRTFTDLLRTGRQAAALDRMLLFIADILDDESRERAKRLTTLAEPIAIVLIALVVGTLVVAILLAMTSLYEFNL